MDTQWGINKYPWAAHALGPTIMSREHFWTPSLPGLLSSTGKNGSSHKGTGFAHTHSTGELHGPHTVLLVPFGNWGTKAQRERLSNSPQVTQLG